MLSGGEWDESVYLVDGGCHHFVNGTKSSSADYEANCASLGFQAVGPKVNQDFIRFMSNIRNYGSKFRF